MSALPTFHEPGEVAAVFGRTRRWLVEAAAARPDLYPSVKIAGRVLFTPEQVEQIVANHTRSAPAPVLTPAERAAAAWGRPRPRAGRRQSG